MSLALVLSVLAASKPIQEIIIDAKRQTPISPYIYGINYPDTWLNDWLKEWESYHGAYTMVREGGNRFTAYNWETNASNAGADYRNENDDYLEKSNEPGLTVRRFLNAVQGTGAAALVTVPILGYVSADKTVELNGSPDVGKTPNYLRARFLPSYPTKEGDTTYLLQNGKVVSGHFFLRTDHSKAIYQDEFVRWVQSVKSPKTPVFFSLDNEPDWWTHTHPRLELKPTTYARIIDRDLDYAAMIKRVAPTSLVFGPVNFGWSRIKDFVGAPDANGRPFAETYLDAVRVAAAQAGHRLLDVYDFHYYPETTGEGVRIIYNQAPDKPGTQVARIQAPRSLWDPTFVEESWITKSLGGKPFMLLPRMKEKIANHYPGTKLAITEYEFGGRNTVSGMLAQADALGVFGRQGLFAACQWGTDHTERPTYAAFEAFTNFDRHGAHFGDLGLQVQGETPSDNSVYAAIDSANRHRLTIVAINKTDHAMRFSIEINGFHPKSIQSYELCEGIYDTPLLGAATLATKGLTLATQPRSIVTVEVVDQPTKT